MQIILITTNCMLALAFIWYIAISTIRLRQMSDKIEDMLLEHDKTKFRLFVVEKKQSIYHENYHQKEAI